MGQPVMLPSFGAGELSPALFARVDLNKFHVGAALLENFFVDYRGGALNRPGTTFAGMAARNKPTNDVTGRFDLTKKVRLIPFTFSTLQTYALEFGHQYMRVIKNGAYVLEATKAISAVTLAAPGVFTSNAHGYSNGDWLYMLFPNGMGQLNGQTVVVTNATANTFTVRKLLSSSDLSTVGYTAYVSGGTAARVYTLTTTYSSADLNLLKFSQSADTMTITNLNYAQQDLTRSGHAAWTLSAITFGSATAAPVLTSVTPLVGAGTTTYRYVITAISADGTEESVASAAMATALGKTMSQTNTESIAVVWGAVGGASRYNIYRQEEVPNGDPTTGAIYGYVGSSTGTTFKDVNIDPDFTHSPPQNTNPFAGANYPSVNGYYQQRQVYAASLNSPETFWLSRPGNRKNFDKSNPVQDNDAITGTVASQQVNAIQHLVPMGKGLVALTSGSAYQISGGGVNTISSPITPSTATAEPQAFMGASPVVPPLVIDYNILYVSAIGSSVRDLSYNFYVNVYTGTDLSILSSHLFQGYMINEWCWAVEPFKTVWAVRNDGILLSFAYLKEQEIAAWAHHNTAGLFRSICQVQEGNETAVYVAVERYIAGNWVMYIERFASRLFGGDITQAWFVDCGLSLGQTYLNARLTPGATTGNNVLFTADANIFAPGDVGSTIRVNGGVAKIVTYLNAQQVRANILLDIGSVYPAYYPDWTCTAPVTTVGGLWHLEGQYVVGVADGNKFGPLLVNNGQITLATAASYIIIGLAYMARFKSLYLDTADPTIQSKRKKISALSVRCKDTRGIKAGLTTDKLRSWKGEAPIIAGQIPELTTGDCRIIMPPQQDTYGQVYVEQDNPWPASILGIIPEVNVGDTPG